jgi:hypothetical protein
VSYAGLGVDTEPVGDGDHFEHLLCLFFQAHVAVLSDHLSLDAVGIFSLERASEREREREQCAYLGDIP